MPQSMQAERRLNRTYAEPPQAKASSLAGNAQRSPTLHSQCMYPMMSDLLYTQQSPINHVCGIIAVTGDFMAPPKQPLMFRSSLVRARWDFDGTVKTTHKFALLDKMSNPFIAIIFFDAKR